MSAVAYVPKDDDPPPRAKPLPRALLTGGGDPPARLPSDLVYRRGARERLFRTSGPARTLIAETCGKILEIFGAGARFALEAVVDVDEVAVEPLLYLVIGAALNAPDAGRALDRFQEEWWLDNVERGEWSVHIGLELL